MRIRRDLDKCYACRVCELMCSFHHTGAFQPERSSIRVHRDYRDGRVFWRIDDTCDLCARESEPLCVRFCAYDALSCEAGEEGGA